jgi:hypothetical protein
VLKSAPNWRQILGHRGTNLTCFHGCSRVRGVATRRGPSLTLTLNIRPEVEAALARQAAAQGRPIETVAAALLEEAVHLPSGAAPEADLIDIGESVRGLLSDEEIDRLFTRNPSTGRPVDLG